MRIIAVILWSSLAIAQNYQIGGGTSSLMDASGGQAKLYFKNSETDLGAGFYGGHFYAGITESFGYRGWKVSAGTVSTPFALRTDFYNTVTPFPAVGMLVTRGDSESRDKLVLFAGATATDYTLPFFFGSKMGTATGGLWWTRRLTPTLTFDSAEVISGSKATAIQTLTLTPVAPLTMSVAGGLGGNSPFAAGRIGWKSLHWSGVASYTHRAPDFRRVVQQYQTFVENDGLNVAGAFSSQHFSVSGDRTHNLSAVKDTVIHSTVNSLTVNGSASIFRANGSVFFGDSAGKSVAGQTIGAGATVGIVSVQGNWFRAGGRDSVAVTASERIGRHWTANQFVQPHSVNFGGDYHSNRLTVSAGYAMSYFPVLNSFQKILSVGISIQLPHGTRLDAGTVTTPDGKTKFTVAANSFGTGPFSDITVGGRSVSGKYSYRGKIVDETGEPVAGALVIGKNEAFGTAKGIVVLPSRKMRTEVLTVAVADFIAPGRWIVVSAPEMVTPETDFVVVVGRRVE